MQQISFYYIPPGILLQNYVFTLYITYLPVINILPHSTWAREEINLAGHDMGEYGSGWGALMKSDSY